MISIFELGYRYLLPALKRMLVEELDGRGLSRSEISRLLKLPPSTVTRYILRERGHVLDLERYEDIREEVRRLAADVAEGRADVHSANARIYRIAFRALAKGYLCSFHSKLDVDVDPKTCRICPSMLPG